MGPLAPLGMTGGGRCKATPTLRTSTDCARRFARVKKRLAAAAPEPPPEQVAFASRKPAETNGSAGRPLTSAALASTSVSEYIPVIASHVQPGRSPQRTAAARKRAKKRMSGGPSPAAPPPGTTKATARAEYTCGWWLTISCVGPFGAKTESASTAGMIAAIRTTQLSCSNSRMNAQPAHV